MYGFKEFKEGLTNKIDSKITQQAFTDLENSKGR